MSRVGSLMVSSLIAISCTVVAMDDLTLAQRVDTYIAPLVEFQEFSGAVLMAENGKVVFKKAYGFAVIDKKIANSVDTRFNIASLTKQFTAAAILLLEEQGMLSVEDPLSKFLPGFPNAEKITLHQLLTHSSGVVNFTRINDYETRRMGRMSMDEALDWIGAQPLDFEPGNKYSYSNSGYLILARIIELVSGKKLDEYLHDEVFAKLGMRNTGPFYNEPSTGEARGYDPGPGGFVAPLLQNPVLMKGNGSLASTVEDLYKWWSGLTSGKLLSEASLQKMFSDHGSGWGYGWTVRERHGLPSAAHDGRVSGFFSYILHFPSRNACVIFLGNINSGALKAMERDLPEILLGRDVETPKPVHEFVEVEPSILQKYVGRYSAGPSIWFDVILEDSHLFMLWLGNGKAYLAPLSENEFYMRIRNEKITFRSAEDGSIDAAIWELQGRAIPVPRVTEKEK